MPSFRHRSAMLSSPRSPSSTTLILFSAEKRRRVARRMSSPPAEFHSVSLREYQHAWQDALCGAGETAKFSPISMAHRSRNSWYATAAGETRILGIVGPGSVGKDALELRLRDAVPGMRKVVSSTTRPQRPDESEGVQYHFLDEPAFAAAAAAGESQNLVSLGDAMSARANVAFAAADLLPPAPVFANLHLRFFTRTLVDGACATDDAVAANMHSTLGLRQVAEFCSADDLWQHRKPLRFLVNAYIDAITEVVFNEYFVLGVRASRVA